MAIKYLAGERIVGTETERVNVFNPKTGTGGTSEVWGSSTSADNVNLKFQQGSWTEGTADSNGDVDYGTYKQITGLTAGDTIDEVVIYIYNASTNVKVAVFTDDSNEPDTLLGGVTTKAVSLSSKYYGEVFVLDTPVTVPANGKVWVCMYPQASIKLQLKTESSSAYANSRYGGSSASYGNAFPSTMWSSTGQGTYNVVFGVNTTTGWIGSWIQPTFGGTQYAGAGAPAYVIDSNDHIDATIAKEPTSKSHGARLKRKFNIESVLTGDWSMTFDTYSAAKYGEQTIKLNFDNGDYLQVYSQDSHGIPGEYPRIGFNMGGTSNTITGNSGMLKIRGTFAKVGSTYYVRGFNATTGLDDGLGTITAGTTSGTPESIEITTTRQINNDLAEAYVDIISVGNDFNFTPTMPEGTLYEESDTGKIYMWDGVDTWNLME